MKKCMFLLVIIALTMFCFKAYAGKLSAYPNTSTLVNGDRIPVVLASTSNANVNWAQFKQLMSQNINWAVAQQMHGNNINWTDAYITGKGINWLSVRVYASSFGGDHSGINWTAFGI